jgi:tetrahydromethanopterin S-methyltransferase subunit E
MGDKKEGAIHVLYDIVISEKGALVYHGEILMFGSVFLAFLSNVWLSSLTN